MGVVPKYYHSAYLVDMGLEKRMVVLFMISDKLRAVYFFDTLEQLNGYFASLFEPIADLELMSKQDFLVEIERLKKEDERLASMDFSPIKKKLLLPFGAPPV